MSARTVLLRTALLMGWLGLSACSPEDSGPVTYSREESVVIEAASRAIRQNEDWAARAEYKLKQIPAGWQVTAWRVEHPEAKGNDRYVPWGYRVIVVDRRGKVVEYKNSK